VSVFSHGSRVATPASVRRNKTALAGPSAGHPGFASVPHGGGVRFAHSIKSWAPQAPHAWHHVSAPAQHVCYRWTSPQSSYSAPLWGMPQMLLARSPHANFVISRKPHRMKTCDKKKQTQKNVRWRVAPPTCSETMFDMFIHQEINVLGASINLMQSRW
jgi:hypothetical protein